MLRCSTKIVATLGPASNDPALLEQMIRAGVDVVRLNFSHGTAQDHIDRAKLVREAAKRAGREVAIMADLQGPKIRVGKFADGKIFLQPGQTFILDAARTELGASAAFAPDGPEKCSGLPTARHDGASLSALLGTEFRLMEERREQHATPGGKSQSFTWCRFVRVVE